MTTRSGLAPLALSLMLSVPACTLVTDLGRFRAAPGDLDAGPDAPARDAPADVARIDAADAPDTGPDAPEDAPADVGCAEDDDCGGASYCDSGACVPTHADGEPCERGAMCASASCADGVCCDTACDGPCVACDVMGSVGVCSAAVEICSNGVDDDCDARTDEPVLEERFDAFGLPGWSLAPFSHGPHTILVGTGELHVSNADFIAATGDSLFTDLATDRGNQLQRPAPIGTGDFELRTEIRGGRRGVGEVTLALLAVLDVDGYVIAAVGFETEYRPPGMGFGPLEVSGWLDDAGTTRRVAIPYPGRQTPVRMVRRAGVLTVELDGVAVVSAANTRSIASLGIVALRQRLGPEAPNFGLVWFRPVSVCF